MSAEPGETADPARDALALLAVDPAGLGGIWARGAAGPAQARLAAGFQSALAPWPARRLPPSIALDALKGGIDWTATLATGRPARAPGLLAQRERGLILTGAERLPAAIAAALAEALDAEEGPCLLALDEGEDEAALPPALRERLAFHLPLRETRAAATLDVPDPATRAAARAAAPRVETPVEALSALVATAASLGIGSLRAPLLALRAARAAAALAGRTVVAQDDLERAAQLVLGPRAAPAAEAAPENAPAEETPPAAPEPADPLRDADAPEAPQDGAPEQGGLDEARMIEAARAALPQGLLDQLVAAACRAPAPAASAGAGALRVGGRRGRPLPSRRGRPREGGRVDLLATLRAAAPWRRLRPAPAPGTLLRILPSDIHLKRFAQARDRTVLFLVDASGSAAMTRLSEVKGAVELLLGEAYATRDHVALIAFRGRRAELLLPPTRSLTRARRALTGLPGGGGTPLASALALALGEVAALRRRGATPSLCLFTDGRGNIALSGEPDRAAAAAETERLAAALRAEGAPALLVDSSPRPRETARRLAAAMAARYLPLPKRGAAPIAAAIAAAGASAP